MSTPQAIHPGVAHHVAHDGDSDLLNVDERLTKEMHRLAAINQELLGNAGGDSKESINLSDEAEDGNLLRAENAELRARIAELEQALTNEPTSWDERQKEYEMLLEEKSEVIRSLHLKIQEMQDPGAAPAASPATLGDVEKLKKGLEEQRRQLEEDEAVVTQQLREMEMAMSKDRAELARQRNEIQRLHNDLNREIEIAARDPGLRDRLVALQRLQSSVGGRKTPPAALLPANSNSAKRTARANAGECRQTIA